MSRHLQHLEAEAIFILREVAAEFVNPVLMYSIGKDSSVLLHLALKAFSPGKPPFPLLHINTTWKFREMIEFRDKRVEELGLTLIEHRNEEGIKDGVSPFTHGSSRYTDIMKTDALKQALSLHKFDCAIGGARRDEEKSRAKERIMSFRTTTQQWDPKNQRPEFWNLYNCRIHEGESVRAFPISNWTEADIWEYIALENIPIAPLYFAKERPVVRRENQWIMVDDERYPLDEGEEPELRLVRFRTLGCYPLTAAMESDATDLTTIIAETKATTLSEREGRLIDHDQPGSMEKKKQGGYF